MKLKTRIGAIALTVAIAVSALSVGFASWKTDITANGNVTANGKWDISVKAADVNVSTGAAFVTTTTAGEALVRTGATTDSGITPYISGGTAETADLIGEQSDKALASNVQVYLVDQTKFDLDMSKMTTEKRNIIVADESTLDIVDYFKSYYNAVKGSSKVTDEMRAKIVDGFLEDATVLLKEMYPDTYQNYVAARLFGLHDLAPEASYVFADFGLTTEESTTVISEDATTVTYADVTFALPGAWAEYTLTIANNGTVNANLKDAVIELETESEQLTLAKPELDDEVLEPGDTCTLTFVVQVPETVEEDLDATGTLTVKLPYAQNAVEAAPAPSHTHN